MSSGLQNSARNQLPTLGELGADLLRVTPGRLLTTLGLPLLAMACFGFFACLACWPLAVVSVMALSFISYGSSSHDLVHHTLGLPRRWNDLLLSLIELFSLRSGTAYRLSHLHHHHYLLDVDDVEGATAHGSLLGAIASGPTMQIKLWLWAWRKHRRMRPRLLAEAVSILTLIGLAILTVGWTPVPLAYVALVVGGSWLFPLITVYIPHDGNAKEPLRQTRLFRGRLVQLIAFHHLYHLEHHLYPAVPHHHWKSLAERLDPHFMKAGIAAHSTGLDCFGSEKR